MQAVRSFFPQFDDLRTDPVTTPSRRPGWPRLVGERFGQLGHPLFEHRSTDDHLALVACNGAATSPRRPRPPVGVRLIVIDLLHCTSHPDLSVHWEEPMEKGSGERIRPQLPTLVAFPVGVEDETTMVDAPEQHHSRGRAPIGRGCGNCHRLGHGFASCPRNLEPPGQLCHRIGIDGRFVHGHSLLARGYLDSLRSRKPVAQGPHGWSRGARWEHAHRTERTARRVDDWKVDPAPGHPACPASTWCGSSRLCVVPVRRPQRRREHVRGAGCTLAMRRYCVVGHLAPRGTGRFVLGFEWDTGALEGLECAGGRRRVPGARRYGHGHRCTLRRRWLVRWAPGPIGATDPRSGRSQMRRGATRAPRRRRVRGG